MKRIPLWVLSQRKLRKQHDQNSPIKKAAEEQKLWSDGRNKFKGTALSKPESGLQVQK